jgi:hypothetical protein
MKWDVTLFIKIALGEGVKREVAAYGNYTNYTRAILEEVYSTPTPLYVRSLEEVYVVRPLHYVRSRRCAWTTYCLDTRQELVPCGT